MEKCSVEFLNQTMASKIADIMRDDILSRNIEPGSRVTTKQLAEKYGVSSMPVREAFNMLCGEGLLEMNPFRGATVKSVTPTMVVQLNDLQYALESLLVELCMKKGYPENVLSEMEEINNQMAAIKDDKGWREKRLGLNIQFHTIEYSPCSDHMAYGLFQKNLRQLANIRKYYKLDMARAKETLVEHKNIMEAIKNNDIDRAVYCTKLHTLNSKLYATSESFND